MTEPVFPAKGEVSPKAGQLPGVAEAYTRAAGSHVTSVTSEGRKLPPGWASHPEDSELDTRIYKEVNIGT